jgi:hypothetical protein
MLPWETLWCRTQHDRLMRHSTRRSEAKIAGVLTAPPEVHAWPCGRKRIGVPPTRGVGFPVFEAVPIVPNLPRARG